MEQQYLSDLVIIFRGEPFFFKNSNYAEARKKLNADEDEVTPWSEVVNGVSLS